MACLQNRSFLEGGKKLYRHSIGTLYPISWHEKLALPYIFADEGGGENVFCLNGYA